MPANSFDAAPLVSVDVHRFRFYRHDCSDSRNCTDEYNETSSRCEADPFRGRLMLVNCSALLGKRYNGRCRSLVTKLSENNT